MTIVTEKHVIPAPGQIFLFETEASEINLRPGEWPTQLPTDMGNRQPFVRHSKKLDSNGDLLWVTYAQDLGCLTLRVFND